MPRFYFLDTNIIIGYCNSFDRLHPVAIPFINSITNKRTIFLLLSVEKEYYRKIRKIRINFEKKIFREFRKDNELELQEIKQKFLSIPNNKDYYFEKFIFENYEKKGISNINHGNLMKILSAFISQMRYNFKQLINHWIVRPRAEVYQTILSDPLYLQYFNRIRNYLHFEDCRHLALAIYIIKNRARGHEYFFYTDDDEFINNHLEQIVNIPNLRIKKIQYKKESRMAYNPDTKSFSIKKKVLKFIPDEDLI